MSNQSLFVVNDFFQGEESNLPTISLKEFCIINKVIPSSDVVLTSEHQYKGVHFKGVDDSKKRLFLMFGKSSSPKVNVGDAVSTSWEVAWVEAKKYFRLTLSNSSKVIREEWV